MSEKLEILERIFGNSKKVGEEHLFFCPQCDHHKAKLSVNIEKNKYKCWLGCNLVGSNIFSLVLRFGTKPDVQMWKEFSTDVKLEDFDLYFSEASNKSYSPVKLPEYFQPLAGSSQLSEGAYDAIEYLARRGIEEGDIKKWKIGFCTQGTYYKRIVIPSFSENGDLNFYCTRDYSGKSKYSYLNSNADKNIVFNEININWNKPITITEGVFDSIKCDNSVPILGKTLISSSYLFRKILENKQDVYMGLDLDAEDSSSKIIKKLISFGVNVFKLDISPYKDLGEMSKQEVEYRKKHALNISDSTDFLRFMILSKL
jgi:hypothetical protein